MAGEMTEMTDKTASCGAITEKRATRPGGCVGIFFQLFDWNRRFAKKKLFSRKSLLPGAKQASKRFGGNEKMPKSKLHLTAHENRERNEVTEPRKHEMKSPGLVARLMGLESMPSINRDKLKKKKSAVPQIHENVKADGLVGKSNVFDREEEMGLEKLRPQKIRKTTSMSVCDRRMVKRFGSEALQMKNILTRAKKQHQYINQHQKLASSVKSPRLYRRSSRLIDAATRILEPGLQTKNKAKPAIAFSGSKMYENTVVDSEGFVASPNPFEFQKGCYRVASCKNCGSLVDVQCSGPVAEETGKNTANISESSSFDKKDLNVFARNQEQSVFVTAKGIDIDGLNCKHRKDVLMSSGFKTGNRVQNRMFQRETASEAQLCNILSTRASPSAAHAVSCKGKEFVAINRGFTSKKCLRISNKVENPDLDLRRRPYTRFDDYSPFQLSDSARKRTLSVSGQRPDVNVTSTGNRAGAGAESVFVPSKPSSSARANNIGLKESKERRWVQSKANQRVENFDYSKTSLQKRLPVDGDSIRELLQRKLIELASQEQDEGGARREGDFADKSTSNILQELISALALDQNVTQKTDIPDAETTYQRECKRGTWRFKGCEHNGDFTSPGSVLEASFSNESCFSNSFDDSSGQFRLPVEPTDHQSIPLEPDFEELLQDSATSIKKPTFKSYQWITNLINHANSVLCSLNNLGGLRSAKGKFNFANAREVIIHAELLFGTTMEKDFLIHPKLVKQLMIHAEHSEVTLFLPGFARELFLVDAMIEYLDLRYHEHIFTGFRGLRTLPLCMNMEILIREVIEELMNWAELDEMNVGEIIEFEMERWFDLDTVLSEIGTEIACVVLKALVCELVNDLLECRPSVNRLG